MTESTEPTASEAPTRLSRFGYQVLCSVLGAAIGAAIWIALAVPQHLINVIFSVLVGIGAGLGAGRVSRLPRSLTGIALAVVVAATVLVVTQVVVTKQYLVWATEHLEGAPSDPSWDGAIGAVRLALDRAAARKGWTANASYFYWTASLVLAGSLAWFTASEERNAISEQRMA
jgi:hypothetical protein